MSSIETSGPDVGAAPIYDNNREKTVPGAYNEIDTEIFPAREEFSATLATAGQKLSSAGRTAASYLPAREDIAKTLVNASQTAASYLPESAQRSLNPYFPEGNDKAGKPTFTSSVGVGDLPGSQSATEVAVLPAERTSLPTSMLESQGTQPGDKSGGVGSLPGKNDEEGVVSKLEKTANKTGEFPSDSAATATSKSKPVFTSSVGGVGVLPGSQSTTSIGVLPAEQTTPPTSTFESQGAHPGDKSNGVGPLPGKSNESGVVHKFEDSAVRSSISNGHPTEDSSKGQQAKDVSFQESKPSPGAKTDSHAPSHKAGFMSKLKGEAKIIKGKLSKNEEKVELGKQIKAGDV